MTFRRDVEKFKKKAEKAAEMIFRGTFLDLSRLVIRRTPVDTGRLRGNWQTSLNAPASAARYSGNPEGEASKESARAKIGDRLILTNNLPYAGRIERGSSRQAPKGMVRVTVREFKRHVARQARKAKK